MLELEACHLDQDQSVVKRRNWCNLCLESIWDDYHQQCFTLPLACSVASDSQVAGKAEEEKTGCLGRSGFLAARGNPVTGTAVGMESEAASAALQGQTQYQVQSCS